MKSETIWIIALVVLLLLVFNGLGFIFGIIKDILIVIILVLLVMFLVKQINKKR